MSVQKKCRVDQTQSNFPNNCIINGEEYTIQAIIASPIKKSSKSILCHLPTLQGREYLKGGEMWRSSNRQKRKNFNNQKKSQIPKSSQKLKTNRLFCNVQRRDKCCRTANIIPQPSIDTSIISQQSSITNRNSISPTLRPTSNQQQSIIFFHIQSLFI